MAVIGPQYGYGDKAQKRFNEEDSDRKVFVGGISLDSVDADLSGYFSQFGEVSNVQIKYDAATGRSRGFAFVEFGTAEACKSALKNRYHEIKNKRCEVKKATSRENKKVFVGGISPDISEEELRAYFVRYGEVEDIEIPLDKTTNRRRNFCFVIFSDERGATSAIEQRKHMLGGKFCDVKLFEPAAQKQHNAQGDGYTYGGGYGYGGAGGYGGGYGAGGYGMDPSAAQGGGYGGAQGYPQGADYSAYWQQYWQYYGQYYGQYGQGGAGQYGAQNQGGQGATSPPGVQQGAAANGQNHYGNYYQQYGQQSAQRE